MKYLIYLVWVAAFVSITFIFSVLLQYGFSGFSEGASTQMQEFTAIANSVL
jgi:hypothetical protein